MLLRLKEYDEEQAALQAEMAADPMLLRRPGARLPPPRLKI